MLFRKSLDAINLITDRIRSATLFRFAVAKKLSIVLYAIFFFHCFFTPTHGQENPIGELPKQGADEDPRNILMSGPMHEAFLEVHDADPKPNATVSKAPPEPINEIPPEFKPDGTNVQWIPGYWGWDFDKMDFVWVSGLWRDVPPDRKWIPGYWQTLDEGYRWISGYWQIESEEDIDYLPTPPASIDSGPSTPAPGDDYFYVPGNWVRNEATYLWCPGYWQRNVADWLWVPTRYVWTPYGCVHRPGYWDHVVDRRGVCFAPIYYSTPLYRSVAYRYTPRYAINVGVNLLPHLFVNLRYGHFYYGDWYATRYRQQGFCPWVNAHRHHRRYYDPLLTYYSHPARRFNNRNCYNWALDRHRHFVDHQHLRPRRCFAPVDRRVVNGSVRVRTGGVSIGVRYTDLVHHSNRRDIKIKQTTTIVNSPRYHREFRQLSKADLVRERNRIKPIHDVRVARRSHEAHFGNPSRNPKARGGQPSRKQLNIKNYTNVTRIVKGPNPTKNDPSRFKGKTRPGQNTPGNRPNRGTNDIADRGPNRGKTGRSPDARTTDNRTVGNRYTGNRKTGSRNADNRSPDRRVAEQPTPGRPGTTPKGQPGKSSRSPDRRVAKQPTPGRPGTNRQPGKSPRKDTNIASKRPTTPTILAPRTPGKTGRPNPSTNVAGEKKRTGSDARPKSNSRTRSVLTNPSADQFVRRSPNSNAKTPQRDTTASRRPGTSTSRKQPSTPSRGGTNLAQKKQVPSRDTTGPRRILRIGDPIDPNRSRSSTASKSNSKSTTKTATRPSPNSASRTIAADKPPTNRTRPTFGSNSSSLRKPNSTSDSSRDYRSLILKRSNDAARQQQADLAKQQERARAQRIESDRTKQRQLTLQRQQAESRQRQQAEANRNRQADLTRQRQIADQNRRRLEDSRRAAQARANALQDAQRRADAARRAAASRSNPFAPRTNPGTSNPRTTNPRTFNTKPSNPRPSSPRPTINRSTSPRPTPSRSSINRSTINRSTISRSSSPRPSINRSSRSGFQRSQPSPSRTRTTPSRGRGNGPRRK